MTTGYKWTERKGDGRAFIITLECYNEFPDNPSFAFYGADSYYSTDCLVKRIEDMYGNTTDSVDGFAFYAYQYYVGQHINNGDRIYYFKDFSTLKEICIKRMEISALCAKRNYITKAWQKAKWDASNDLSYYLLPEEERISKITQLFFKAGFAADDLPLIHEEFK